jgi:hypothetical protein
MPVGILITANSEVNRKSAATCMHKTNMENISVDDLLENIRILLKYIISQKRMKKNKCKTGILDEGKDNIFVNVSSEGFDVGFHERGEGSVIVGGKHTGRDLGRKWWEKNWFQIIYLVAAILGIISFLFILKK